MYKFLGNILSSYKVQHCFKKQSLVTDFQFKLPDILLFVYFCNSTIPTVDVQNKKRNVHQN